MLFKSRREDEHAFKWPGKSYWTQTGRASKGRRPSRPSVGEALQDVEDTQDACVNSFSCGS